MQQQERVEIRANIKFCRELGKTPTETYKMLRSTKAGSKVSRTLVFKWFHQFEDGRESLDDDKGRERHAVIGERHVTSLKKALEDNPLMTVRELAEVADVSIGSAYSILKTTLNMRKVHARLVPRILKDHERERRLMMSKSFLKQYERNPATNFPNVQISLSTPYIVVALQRVANNIASARFQQVAYALMSLYNRL